MTSIRGVRALALAAAFTVAGAGCERGFVQDPTPTESVAVALELAASGGAGGPADAFDRADRIFVRVRAGDRIRLERDFPIQPGGTDLQLPLLVPTMGRGETVTFEVELRLGETPLFRGGAQIALRVGRAARLALALDAVASGLALPDDLPDLTSYGDVIVLKGALIFATGDTIELADLEWTSLDPAVIGVVEGVPTALADGQARLVARVDALTDTLRVRVFAAVHSIVVSPNLSSLGLGESRLMTALLRDARGNPIPDRTVLWVSTDTLIIRIAANGLATGVGVGIARISARSGGISSEALVEALAAAPKATTDEPDQIVNDAARLHGRVTAGGVPTQVWFEWAREPSFTASFLTPFQDANGAASVAIQAELTGLTPNTTYFYRVRARNDAGSSIGDAKTFTTNTGVPFTVTAGVTDITTTSAKLHGRVISNGAGTAWFEIGTADDPASFTRRASVTLGAGNTPIGIADAVTGLEPGTTYYFRLVASTSVGSMAGTVYSFRTLTPENRPPIVTTLPAGPVHEDGAVANGAVNPNGLATQAWFEYDTDPDFSEYTSTPKEAIGAGVANVAVQALLQGLSPGETYYVRAAASNADGTVRGAVVSFTTVTVPVPPAVETVGSDAIDDTGAILRGSANPNGFATDTWFQYGTDSYLSGATTTPTQSIGAGTGDVPLAEILNALLPNTTYYFRAVAANEAGTVVGEVLTFTTLPSPLPPAVTTLPADPVRTDGAVANALVHPNGLGTLAWFDWGVDPTLDNHAATAPRAVGAGTAEVAFQESIEGLTPSTTFYVRAAASNAAGTTIGDIVSFTTASLPPVAPDVSTDSAGSNIGQTSAHVFGTANANGFATSVWFEYGDSDFESVTATPPQDIGAGTTDVGFTAQLTGLEPDTKVYYRAVAANATDTVRGAKLNFTTLAPPAEPPAVVTDSGRVVVDSDGNASLPQLYGRVNPNGLATEAWFEYGFIEADSLHVTGSTDMMDIAAGTAFVPFTDLLIVDGSGSIRSASTAAGTGTWFRAVARNALGTVYGVVKEIEFVFPEAPDNLVLNLMELPSGPAIVSGTVVANGSDAEIRLVRSMDPTRSVTGTNPSAVAEGDAAAGRSS